MVLGAIQIPPSGEPIVFLADHPVTGGYPVIGVVTECDVDLLAQAAPGTRIRFTALQNEDR
jgi:allophanate hydrolase subunit 2